MHKRWIGCSASNYKSGRGGLKPEAIVIHRSGGELSQIDARLNQSQTFRSAHYAVGVNGEVHQYVEESDTAFHAGIVVNPSWSLVKAGVNPNLYTISIELEGSPGDSVSATQYDAAAALILDIAQASEITLDAEHISLHEEIRAGCGCPGDGFDRTRLLHDVQARAAQPQTAGVQWEVTALRATNVRERAPSTSARIVRVIPAGSSEVASDFTDRGERVGGSSYWYRTEDGNYFWAGSTNVPNPVRPVPAVLQEAAPRPVAPSAAASAQCGIQRIDELFAGIQAAGPIRPGDTDAGAIGAVQDLLTGHGFAGLPSVVSSSYGTFGDKTGSAIRAFQGAEALPVTGEVDTATLQKLVHVSATDPRASQVYLSLVLGLPATGMHKILSFVAQMEGAGKFAALNRNTDRAGLSFGLIQWAQRPGRLAEILAAMCQADRSQFVEIFGEGDDRVADALVAYTNKLCGGVDPKTGITTSPAFDLISEPWITRFRKAALVASFQQAQVDRALAAFEASRQALKRYANSVTSERGVGFMLDVANQFGDAGTAKVYAVVNRPGMVEKDLLEAVAEETIARVDDSLKAGVRARRERFLECRFLSDDPFRTGGAAQAAIPRQ
jgi:hypothetical protein